MNQHSLNIACRHALFRQYYFEKFSCALYPSYFSVSYKLPETFESVAPSKYSEVYLHSL